MTNINQPSHEEKVSRIYRALASPVRLQILAVIGRGEACVCHLEALLNLRQAYISQQLMELRDAELLTSRRDGRYIYYRLADVQLLDNIKELGQLFEVPFQEIVASLDNRPLSNCPCPHCQAAAQKTLISEQEIKTG